LYNTFQLPLASSQTEPHTVNIGDFLLKRLVFVMFYFQSVKGSTRGKYLGSYQTTVLKQKLMKAGSEEENRRKNPSAAKKTHYITRDIIPLLVSLQRWFK
jgi:hypothetical protein